MAEEKEVKKVKNVASVTHLKDITIQDLVAYERAASIVCQKYENSLRQYDGSIAQDNTEYKRFELVNKTHHIILDELENRLNGLK